LDRVGRDSAILFDGVNLMRSFAVLHFDKLNETEYTMAAEYEQQAMAQADAVLSRLKNKFEVER
jgi:hypothetical protein